MSAQMKTPLPLLSRHNLCWLHSRAKLAFDIMKSFRDISESRLGFLHDDVAEISITDPIRLANTLGGPSKRTMKYDNKQEGPR